MSEEIREQSANSAATPPDVEPVPGDAPAKNMPSAGTPNQPSGGIQRAGKMSDAIRTFSGNRRARKIKDKEKKKK